MIDNVFALLAWVIKTGVGVVIALMLLRGIIGWLNLNPFGTFAYHVCRITEPMVDPLRRNLFAMHSGKDIAPFLLVVFVIIIAYFLLGLLAQFHEVTQLMVSGMGSVFQGQLFWGIRLSVGALVLGALALITTCIIMQVFFSWIGMYGNRFTRLIMRISEPILGPFRRMVPTIGMIDVSPIIAIMMLSLLSAAVRSVIL
jgi:YggT family protein